jgi:FHA domain
MTACPLGHDSVATDYCDVCGRRMDAAAGQATAGVTAVGQAMTGGTAGPTMTGQTSASPASAQAQRCRRCGTVRSGRFCEGCGLDLDAPMPADPPPVPPSVPRAESPNVADPDPATGLAGRAGESAIVGAGGASGASGAGDAGQSAAGGSAASGQPDVTPDTAAPAAWSAVATADRAYFDTVTTSSGPGAAALEFPAYCPERRFPLTGQEMRIGRRSTSRGLTPEIDLTGPPLDPGISRLHAVLVARPGLGWAVIDPGSENGTMVNGHDIATGVPVPLHDGDRIHLGAWTLITVSTADSGQT